MDAESWRRLETLFFGALELAPEERAAFLRRECGDDAGLRMEVEAMLASHARSGEVALPTADPVAEAGAADPLIGHLVGPYQLEERVGRGGMGEVYRAKRIDDHYRQEVAVKLIRASLAPEEMARRFRLERQILARLQHPGIAPLLDGGVTPEGRPYLVMQYVRGLPITEYADRAALPLNDRLRLFATVCRAVQFAHANLVVHRDLKPSNILVTDDGQVRLLDFGIAKLLDPEGMGVTAPLTGEQLLLTPEHAAPEQILGDAITTATDVYALGILLYELLTGTRPFRATLGGSWHRAVVEAEPPRPSAALTTLASGPTERDAAMVASVRGTRRAALEQRLRGDLDQIVLMALRKEPERRYASAEQFAEDVERYLEGRPVLARRDTFVYRARKFTRRNRLGVIAAAALALTLMGATGFSAWQSRARALALAEAQAERDKAATLAEFMLDVFAASDPASARGRAVTAGELLDQAAARIDREMSSQPLLQADLQLAIGRAYGALGLFDEAQPLLEGALRQRRARLPPDDPRVTEAVEQVGKGFAALGRFERAIPMMEEALAARERQAGRADTAIAATLSTLARAQIEVGEYEAAEANLTRAVAIHRGQPRPDPRGLSEALRFIWLAMDWQGEGEKGFPYVEEALRVAGSALRQDDPHLLRVSQDYALGLERLGMLDSAAAVHQRTMAGHQRIQGPEHVDVSYSYHNLGRVLFQLGRSEEALEAYRRGLEIREKALGADHIQVSHILHSYAIALAMSGEIDQAADLLERAIPIRERVAGPVHVNTFTSMELQAQLRALQGRHEEAIRMLETLVERGWANRQVMEGTPFSETARDPRFVRLREVVRGGG